MSKDVIITTVVSLFSSVATYFVTNWYNQRSQKLDLYAKALKMYEELSINHIQLQENFNAIARDNNDLKNKVNELETALKGIKKENHALRRKVVLMQGSRRKKQ